MGQKRPLMKGNNKQPSVYSVIYVEWAEMPAWAIVTLIVQIVF